MKKREDKDELDYELWISNRALAITALITSALALFLAWIQLP